MAAIFWGGEKWPGLRESFYAWRYPIVIVLAVYAGYQWHGYDYARSQEARLNEAVRWACAKSPLCQEMAVEYLAR